MRSFNQDPESTVDNIDSPTADIVDPPSPEDFPEAAKDAGPVHEAGSVGLPRIMTAAELLREQGE